MRVKKIKILFLFLLFIGSAQAQVSEYEYKAAFIERFTRFIEWPNEIGTHTFKIVILGQNPFNNSLVELFDGVKIKNKNVELIYTDDIKDLSKVDLVFISKSEKRRIDEIILALRTKPILIISDSKGFCKTGVHINMYVDDNYVRYEINQIAIEKSGLKVSSMLLSTAKIVEADE